VALKAGCKIDTPALTVNRLCGSGFEAVIQAARDIDGDEVAVVLAGGTESMSQAPFAIRNARFGIKLGANLSMEDTLWQGLTDTLSNTPMGITAENLAIKYNITREDSDKYALSSQQRWKAAHDKGLFKVELTPLQIKAKGGKATFEVDEHPRPDTTLATLAKLASTFKSGGVVTAGSASGICDGGAALIVASQQVVKQHNLKPLARIVGYSVAGVEPTLMGIGPVPAVRKLLEKAGMTLNDIDQIELNEAFASQTLAVAKELGVDMNKLNMHGGAIAVGHPLGMSGARILTHLSHCLNNGIAKNYAIGTACIGGGQGVAVLLQKA